MEWEAEHYYFARRPVPMLEEDVGVVDCCHAGLEEVDIVGCDGGCD